MRADHDGSRTKRELVILIRPTVVGEEGTWPDADVSMANLECVVSAQGSGAFVITPQSAPPAPRPAIPHLDRSTPG